MKKLLAIAVISMAAAGASATEVYIPDYSPLGNDRGGVFVNPETGGVRDVPHVNRLNKPSASCAWGC